MAVRYDMEMIRGDTLGFGVHITPTEGTVVDGIRFTIRKSATDKRIIAQKSIGSGITPGPDNHYRVRLAPEDTAQIEAGTHWYDLEITIGEDVYTPIKGKLKIEQDVTWKEDDDA